MPSDKYINLNVTFFLVILFCASALIFSKEFNLLSTGERGWIEISTALIFLYSGIFLIFEKRYIIGALLIFFFLEESSFFLWFFYYDVGGIVWFFGNVQSEPNFHNLNIFQSGSFLSLPTDIIEKGVGYLFRPYYLFLFWIYYILVIAPFFSEFLDRSAFRLWNKVVCFGFDFYPRDKIVGICFLVCQIVLVSMIYPFPDARLVLGELRELCYSFCLSIFFVSRLYFLKNPCAGCH